MALVTAALAAEITLAAMTRQPTAGKTTAEPRPHRLPVGTLIDKPLGRLPLLDERGRRTSLTAFRGRYLVLAPSLTLCHEVCPITVGALTDLQRELRAEGLDGRVVVAQASVDPWRDSPARVRAFRRRTGSDIRFLTGTKTQIRRLWRTFGVEYRRVRQDNHPDVDWWTHRPERFDVTHTDGVFIIDPRGHWRVAALGMPDAGRSLPERLTSLLNDEGRANLRQPDAPWSAEQILGDLRLLMGRPAARAPAPVRDASGERPGAVPAALAGLRAEANRLLAGGTAAVRRRLAALRGQPVVVNAWASWCPPCRQELPLFAAAAARYGHRVAFVGLDVNDERDAAHDLLTQHPVPYPSYADTDGSALGALAHAPGLPTTVYLDAKGAVAFVHVGEYRDEAALVSDIGNHAAVGRWSENASSAGADPVP